MSYHAKRMVCVMCDPHALDIKLTELCRQGIDRAACGTFYVMDIEDSNTMLNEIECPECKTILNKEADEHAPTHPELFKDGNGLWRLKEDSTN